MLDYLCITVLYLCLSSSLLLPFGVLCVCVCVCVCIMCMRKAQHNSHHLRFFLLLIIKQLEITAAVPIKHTKQTRVIGIPTARAIPT